MESANKVLYKLIKQGSPLAKSITLEEMPNLISSLRRRLNLSEEDLDVSPSSLKTLEASLIQLYKKGSFVIDESEKLSVVREIAGYIGQVLLLHANGELEPLGTLLSTHVVFNNVVMFKEGKRKVIPKINYSLGNLAAVSLDKIESGKKPNIYKYYLNAKKRVFVENV
jgi:hypothetical protein